VPQLAGRLRLVGRDPPSSNPAPPARTNRNISAAASTDLSKVGFTPADAKFMQGMIGHHQQALEMVALIADRTSRDEHEVLGKRSSCRSRTRSR